LILLIKKRFKANPRDPCELNKEMYGKHLTICMHADDLMIGSQDPSGVNYVIDILNQEYAEANVYEGKNIAILE